ncbi:hypothetical protein BJ508DRAFT_327255 [Ascobolus immersus RN42]|uniref:Uncharacterized protein n=1 Tax=Ascobolus immersus RN42 TaxID=1160509 RepID=A0A3N4I361_ASCIM|nr:hypothetical protein BJ508DRAFT_327255 [Ascobolus immersus RN42]
MATRAPYPPPRPLVGNTPTHTLTGNTAFSASGYGNNARQAPPISTPSRTSTSLPSSSESEPVLRTGGENLSPFASYSREYDTSTSSDIRAADTRLYPRTFNQFMALLAKSAPDFDCLNNSANSATRLSRSTTPVIPVKCSTLSPNQISTAPQ